MCCGVVGSGDFWNNGGKGVVRISSRIRLSTRCCAGGTCAGPPTHFGGLLYLISRPYQIYYALTNFHLLQVARALGLAGASVEVKRAIQFGTRIAKQVHLTRKKRFAKVDFHTDPSSYSSH